jgi:hypothetical protein
MKSWYKIAQFSQKIAQSQEYYHVTLTEHVPSILEKGIIPQGGASNWVKGTGERYGQGEVHTFQTLRDAVKWGASWDWQLSTSFGSGQVSIIKFKPDEHPWEADESDPISQMGRTEDWLKRMRMVHQDDILEVLPLTHDLVVENSKFE